MTWLDQHWPPSCGVCQKFGWPLCDRCWQRFCPVLDPTHQPKSYPGLKFIWSAFEYRDELKALVIRVKYKREWAYGGLLARLIDLQIGPNVHRLQPTLLLPVPLHPQRQRWRGFNQAEVIARELSKLWHVPLDTTSLRRSAFSQSQKGQSRLARQRLRTSFQLLDTSAIQGQRVLIIDDVTTTGATLGACARELEKGQPKWIGALTLAREI